MLRSSLFLVVALALASGCRPPDPKLDGSYAAEPGPATLTILGKRFKLENGSDLIEGEWSRQRSTMWLHSRTLNGRDEENAFLHSVKEAQEQGKVTDMEIVGTIWDTWELTISDDARTLTMKSVPKMANGKEPYSNSFRAFRKG